METKWLEDFVSLAETRSFSRSAQLRHVTQPAFSRRIQALEAWAGTDLVDRSSYPTRLTPAGKTMYDQALEMLQSLQSTRTMLRSHVSAGKGMVGFAVPHTLAFTFFPAWVSALHEQFGPFKSRLIALNVHDAVMRLVEGGCDLLIAYHHSSQPLQLDANKYEMVSLGQELLAPYSKPDAQGQPLYALPGTAAQPLPTSSARVARSGPSVRRAVSARACPTACATAATACTAAIRASWPNCWSTIWRRSAPESARNPTAMSQAPAKVASQASSLTALMLPLSDRQLLLPNVALAEVIAYRGVQATPGMPDWFLGQIAWRDLNLPLMSFERASGAAAAEGSGVPRVAVLNALGGRDKVKFIALLVQGIPRSFKVDGELPRADVPLAPLELDAVSLGEDVARIPDLVALEQKLADAGLI